MPTYFGNGIVVVNPFQKGHRSEVSLGICFDLVSIDIIVLVTVL